MELIVIRYLSTILSEIKDKGHILPHILSSMYHTLQWQKSDLPNERSIEKITPFCVHLLLDQFSRFFIDASSLRFVCLLLGSFSCEICVRCGNLKIMLSEFCVWVKRIYFWHALKFRREFSWRQSRSVEKNLSAFFFAHLWSIFLQVA